MTRDYNYEKSVNYSKLVKERFLYLPYYPLPDLSEYIGEVIEVRISTEYLSKENKAFIEKRIWGSDIYTSDSDPVCILQHSGHFKIKDLPPSNFEGLSFYFRVSKGRSAYNASLRHGIKSKKMSNYQGHSIKPENYSMLKHLGTKTELLQMASKMPVGSEYERKKSAPKKLSGDSFLNEFNLIFNCANEMWLHYSLPAIADKGRDVKEFTSWKLKDKVLYLETANKRYEIARNVSDHTNDDYLFEEYETYRLSLVKEPCQKDNDFMQSRSIPLNEDFVDVIFSRFDWHELQWGRSSLVIRNLEIENLKCFNFYNIN